MAVFLRFVACCLLCGMGRWGSYLLLFQEEDNSCVAVAGHAVI